MNGRVIILLTIILTGCATPADLRSNKPDLELSSSKPSKNIAICISEAWSNTIPIMAMSSFPTNMQLRENGYSVSVVVTNMLGASWPVVIADISDEQNGSLIRYFQKMPGYGSYKDAMTKCE